MHSWSTAALQQVHANLVQVRVDVLQPVRVSHLLFAQSFAFVRTFAFDVFIATVLLIMITALRPDPAFSSCAVFLFSNTEHAVTSSVVRCGCVTLRWRLTRGRREFPVDVVRSVSNCIVSDNLYYDH